MAVQLQKLNRERLAFWIRGTSPLIQHKWSDKAKRLIEEKQSGKKTKAREARDPDGEAMDATYLTEDGKFGVPAMAIKCAMISAAHKDIGIEKTLVRKAVFFRVSDSDMVLPMECAEPVVREDMVRVGQGSADIRYRPMFDKWRVRVEVEVDADLLKVDDVVNLVNRAGFGVGIGEWRPEKGGEYGRFELDTSESVETMSKNG